jgi:hypothetical protein
MPGKEFFTKLEPRSRMAGLHCSPRVEDAEIEARHVTAACGILLRGTLEMIVE